jgi:hypothetical protein
MSKNRARSKAVIAVIGREVSEMLRRAGQAPAAAQGRLCRSPRALGGTISRTDLIRALAMYCSSDGYLERVLPARGASTWKANLQA